MTDENPNSPLNEIEEAWNEATFLFGNESPEGVVDELRELQFRTRLPRPREDWPSIDIIERALVALAKAIPPHIGEARGSFEDLPLGKMAEVMVLNKTIIDALHQFGKMLSKQQLKMEEQMCQAIAKQDMDRFSTKTHTFIATAEAYINLPPYGSEKYHDLTDWLRENGYGDLIREEPWKAGVQKLVRERLMEGETVPTGVGTFIKASVKVRRKHSTGE